MLSLYAKQEAQKILTETSHSLCLDDVADIVKLDKLCKDITDNTDPINDIIDMPICVGGYQLKQPTIGILEWYNEYYLPMFDNDALMADAGLAYALSLADTPKMLWDLPNVKSTKREVKRFIRGLGCSHAELQDALKRVLNIQNTDEVNDDSDEADKQNAGRLIAMLCKEYGHTAPYWLWECPIGMINTFVSCYVARIEAETESVRNACKTNKPAPAESRKKKFKALRDHTNMMRDKWQKM